MVRGRLEGKVALITGASRGIGRGIAQRFAHEGASVVINHFRDEAEGRKTLDSIRQISSQRSFEVSHQLIDADIGDEPAIDAMFDEVFKHHRRLDILVNNAGFQLPTAGHDFDSKTFNQILGVDLIGPALCARRALRQFLDQGSGCIINTTSAHEIIPKPGYLAYSIAKGGLGSLTRTLALEYADKSIRINAVGPGAVLTDMNAAWANDPEKRASVESHIPMRRAATIDEISGIYVFLASDDAAYITGQTIFACGGLSLYGDFKENWAS